MPTLMVSRVVARHWSCTKKPYSLYRSYGVPCGKADFAELTGSPRRKSANPAPVPALPAGLFVYVPLKDSEPDGADNWKKPNRFWMALKPNRSECAPRV